MQTTPKARRITQQAHSFYPTLPIAEQQIVVKDTRLRNWKLSSDGGLTNAAVLKAGLNGNGEIVRIRTLEGSPYLYTGALDIQWATPGDTLSWSGNTITEDAFYGAGVDLWIDGNDLDAFWLDSDELTIKTSHSSDGGHTWGSSSTVFTLSGQGLNVLPQLCAPQLDTLIFTDSTVGADDNGNPLTALYVAYKSSGTWQTPVLWDLGGQPLGIEQRVTLPNGQMYPSNISGMVLSNGSIGISFYGNSFRESFEAGIWLEKVAGLNLSTTDQHLYWAKPLDIWQSIPIDDDNGATEMFSCFPRIQRVGEEYWIIALESSQQAGHQRYNLAFYRSTDGLVWSDRNYRQGAAYDADGDSEDTLGAYAFTNPFIYSSSEPFLYTDLIYASLVVTEERTFIIGYDRTFWCPSTVLVGVENPEMALDISDLTYAWDVDLPQAPSAGQATYNLGTIPKDWEGKDILTSHRGVIIEQMAGYLTSEGDELITLGKFHVDNINQTTSLGEESGVVTALDNTLLMDRYKSPIDWEFFGPTQISQVGFCDTTMFNTIYGSYYTSVAGNLKSGNITSQDNFRDDAGAINMTNPDGGILITRFRCDRTWDNNHVGIAFDGRDQGDGDDNKKFWAVFYNRLHNRWALYQAEPRANPNRVKLYRYRLIYTGDEALLNAHQAYWLRIAVYHSHVMVWYTTNNDLIPDPTWIKVLDYTAPSTPATAVMQCRIGWWGLLGSARTTPSGALGQLSSRGGMQDLSDGSGNPRIVALHVKLGPAPSVLRRVNVALTQENTSSVPMPDANIFLVGGDASDPFDMTDDDNILFQANASALFFGAHDSPTWKGLNNKPNPRLVKLDAEQDVWIAVSFNDALVAGQSYKYASGAIDLGSGATRYSDDGGQTWNSFGEFGNNLCACIEVEYFAGLVKFSRLYFGGAEPTYTIEGLAHRIASKSEVLDISPDDFLNTGDLVLGADNIYWQPESFGKIGTLVLDADVDTIGSPYSRIARVIVGSTTTTVGDLDGFIVEIDPDTQDISFYQPGNVLFMQTQSLCWIGDSFHVQVVNQNGFLYVYLNETLASNCPLDNIGIPGYVGVDSLGATWINVRIPDLTQIVQYWNIQTNESALSSLQKLVAKPAPGIIQRGRFFIRYDGSLRISSFSRQEVTDEYFDTILSTSKAESQRNNVSQIRQSQNFYADHTDPVELDTDGVIFDQRDSSNARTDEDAYTDSTLEFIASKQQQILPSFEHTAVMTPEREDLIGITSPTDETYGNANINSIHIHYDVDSAESIQQLQPRLAVNDA